MATLILEQLNPGACKTYLVASETTKQAMLVDPLAEHVDRYQEELARRGLHLEYVLDTHVHADHLSGCALLRQRTGAKYVMHRNSVAPCVDLKVDDGDSLSVGDLSVGFLHTPGHTQDGMTVKLPGALLTGDFLFIGEGGAGRTDLPGGDAAEHWAALRKLEALDDGLRVYPGHDYHGRAASTLGEERQKNPRLSPRSEADYVSWLEGQVLGPAAWMEDVIRANYACATTAQGLHIPDEKPACEMGGTKGDAVRALVRTTTCAELMDSLRGGERPLVVDVREPGEFHGQLGHIEGAKLLPLGQLAQRASELEAWRQKPIVMVCASGGRSSAATGILTAGGFTQVQSLLNGMMGWTSRGLPVERDHR